MINYKNLELTKDQNTRFVSIKDASIWASHYLNKKVTISNISYLIQYGRITKHNGNGMLMIDIKELKEYYDSCKDENYWKNSLGNEVNMNLSFSQFSERERTKHVHRLHPYKGKFIPQLVEYFIDSHTDRFKENVFFNKGDILLDPFCGSGTTLVQANECGMHAIGIDVSQFNAMMSNIKVDNHNLALIHETLKNITSKLNSFQKANNNVPFEEELLRELTLFNNKYFPSPEYRRKIHQGLIDEYKYANSLELQFLKVYFNLIQKYDIIVKQDNSDTFLDHWFLKPVRNEIDFVLNEINKIDNQDLYKIVSLVLSRTVRSCRATTHADLGTLKKPVTATYYCKKHGKICKPIFSIMNWWNRYSKDTVKRLAIFDKLKTNTYQICLTGDSRSIDIIQEIQNINPQFAEILNNKKISGVFSSPPYVGLIDYHEQHAYAYELFGLIRKDHMEIGPLSKGQGEKAKESYVSGIAQVLINCKRFFKKDYNVFLVANDKYGLYPNIAQLSGMKIVDRFLRPVLHRVEKDRETPYSETIFHFKES